MIHVKYINSVPLWWLSISANVEENLKQGGIFIDVGLFKCKVAKKESTNSAFNSWIK